MSVCAGRGRRIPPFSFSEASICLFFVFFHLFDGLHPVIRMSTVSFSLFFGAFDLWKDSGFPDSVEVPSNGLQHWAAVRPFLGACDRGGVCVRAGHDAQHGTPWHQRAPHQRSSAVQGVCARPTQAAHPRARQGCPPARLLLLRVGRAARRATDACGLGDGLRSTQALPSP